jgi:hypothetical protein
MFKAKTGKMVKPSRIYARWGAAFTRRLYVKLGDPMVIEFRNKKIAYIVYSPLATLTASGLAEVYRQQGYDVCLVNGASQPAKADKLQKWAVKTYSHLCSIS